MVCSYNVTAWDALEILNVKMGGLQQTGQDELFLDNGCYLGPEFKYWSTYKLMAQIGVDYDLRYYPFDRIYVPIKLETVPATMDLRLSYDTKESTVSPNFTTDASVELKNRLPLAIQEQATYSDAYLTQDPAEIPVYDRVTVLFEFYRDDTTNFIQTMLPTYLSFILSLGALVLPVTEHFDARMGILGASIFVVVLNIPVLNSFLGYPTVMTTGDIINVTTLLMVGIIFIESIVEKWLLIKYEKKKEQEQALLDYQEAVAKYEGDVAAHTEAVTNAINGSAVVADKVAASSTEMEVNVSTATQRKSGLVPDASRPPAAPVTQKKEDIICFGLFRAPSDDKYHDFLVSMSMITFVIMLVAYVAINVGLLVGYRPKTCFEDFKC